MLDHPDSNNGSLEEQVSNDQPIFKDSWQKRAENIIYNIYLQ